MLFPDTRPEAEAVLIDLLRKTPPWRKLEMVFQMNEAVQTMMLSGLRDRYPGDSPDLIHRKMAELLLGPELAVHTIAHSGGTKMPVKPFEITFLVIDTFEKLNVPYFIGGSLASALHGTARSTLDADLVANLHLEQVDQFVEMLHQDFYVDDEMIRDAIQHQSSFNVIHLDTAFKVDVFIVKTAHYNQEQFQRRRLQVVGDEPARRAYVATAEDIILAKLDWYRQGGEVSDRQWRDILGVLKVQAGHLDLNDLHKWAFELGVADLLQKAIKESQ